MKLSLVFLILIMVIGGVSKAQKNDTKSLFGNDDLLELRLAYSFRTLSKNKVDSIYHPTYLHYKSGDVPWDSIKVNVQARGNFRRNHCFYIPLRIDISKKDSKGTLFAGHKSLKLVLPCEVSKNSNDLIIKEYLCYQFYQSITPLSYQAKLATIYLTNLRDKQSKSYQLPAFFIENNGSLANRNGGKMTDKLITNPLLVQDTAALRMDFFQYMIANTDWSMVNQHNVRILLLPTDERIPVPYDFDMAGFIDAPYSQVSNLLPIKNVRERLYRGVCRDEAIMEYIRQEYIMNEKVIMESVKTIEELVNPRELTAMKKYLSEFFEILKDDRKYKTNILQSCRTGR